MISCNVGSAPGNSTTFWESDLMKITVQITDGIVFFYAGLNGSQIKTMF